MFDCKFQFVQGRSCSTIEGNGKQLALVLITLFIDKIQFKIRLQQLEPHTQ